MRKVSVKQTVERGTRGLSECFLGSCEKKDEEAET